MGEDINKQDWEKIRDELVDYLGGKVVVTERVIRYGYDEQSHGFYLSDEVRGKRIEVCKNVDIPFFESYLSIAFRQKGSLTLLYDKNLVSKLKDTNYG
ncbi:hypothetical protein HY212_03395 [Candidatus Pacearchaeota archaeon]|nr:hypothetical protein [Candidatus Pacearchaeota archaeon]